MKKENEDERRRGEKKRKKTDNAVIGTRREGERVDDVFRGCFIGWFPWGGNFV